MSNKVINAPFYRLDRLSAKLDIDLWIKRDDLIPHYLGGNKVRKNLKIISSLKKTPDVIITNGGAESNHARVVALMGAQLGCKVHLVLHGEEPSPDRASGNSFFYRAAGAETDFVESKDIAPAIQALESGYLAQGLSVLVVPGGGHSADGAAAYAEAINELTFEPDYIVHASGTGGTQAGLLQGVIDKCWQTQVVGVSVARTTERGAAEIAKLLPSSFPLDKIDLREEYRFGGYEQFSDDLLRLVKSVVREEGIPLDLTYTGKAMFGLHQLVATGEIKQGSKVVFWHTGGLLNLTSIKL